MNMNCFISQFAPSFLSSALVSPAQKVDIVPPIPNSMAICCEPCLALLMVNKKFYCNPHIIQCVETIIRKVFIFNQTLFLPD